MSPDGRWLALVTSAAGPGTGTQEVVVTDYPAGARRIVISRGGGVAPLWRADGRELFYRTYDGGVMSVSWNDGVAGAPKLQLQLPRPHVDEGVRQDSLGLYAVSPDGRRFFAAVPLTGALPTGYVVTQNWTSRLAAP